jgi:alkanesulfonate monooxygenase SsuD/methylene tetrahydromethanopterin reductase-like flavin-dependent oxidoreductase (luciferase family)
MSEQQWEVTAAFLRRETPEDRERLLAGMPPEVRDEIERRIDATIDPPMSDDDRSAWDAMIAAANARRHSDTP